MTLPGPNSSGWLNMPFSHLDDGEALFEQGDPAKRFYLLLRGQIKLFRLSPAGNEKVVDIVVPGGTFAEALMFLEQPLCPVGAVALQASEVVSIDATDFVGMLRESIDTCFDHDGGDESAHAWSAA